MARPTAPAVACSDVAMDGSTGAMMRRSIETTKASTNSSARAFIRSSIQKVGPPGPGERGQAGTPRGLEARERRAPLDREADRVGAAEQVDRELLPLELVGRPLPAEAPRGLAACLDDQGQVRREGSEPIPVGHVHLHAAAGAAGPLVERGLERGGAEAHAAEPAALQRRGPARPLADGGPRPPPGARWPPPPPEVGAPRR